MSDVTLTRDSRTKLINEIEANYGSNKPWFLDVDLIGGRTGHLNEILHSPLVSEDDGNDCNQLPSVDKLELVV